MWTRRWAARRRALTRLAPYLSRDDVDAAARALAAEAGLEVVAVRQVRELDGDDDAHAVPEENVVVIPPADASEPDDLADSEPAPDPAAEPEAEPDARADAKAEAEREAQRAWEERRRAVLAETEAALAKGRQWEALAAGRR